MTQHARRWLAVLLVLAVLPALPRSPLAPRAAQAGTLVFSNNNGVGVTHGAGGPYPSTITVAGLTNVMDMSVTLNAFSYAPTITANGCDWNLIDVLLVNPAGQGALL